VLTLDAGTNKMEYAKSGILSFNGGLYFHLYKNDYNVIITSISDLVSSPLITISTPSYTISENLASAITASSLVFNGTTYPISLNSTTTTPITSSTVSFFTSFKDQIFYVPWPPLP